MCGNDYRRRNIAYVTPDDFHPCINIAFSHNNDLGGTVTMLWFQGYFLQVIFSMLIDTFATFSVINMTILYKSWLPYLQGYTVYFVKLLETIFSQDACARELANR